MAALIRPLLSSAKTLLVRQPRDELARLRRWGPRAYFRIEAWKRQMESAALELPRLDRPSGCSGISERRHLPVWFMTGDRYWYQTLFCAWSLAFHSDLPIKPLVIDDGTLQDWQADKLISVFPDTVVFSASTCSARREEVLPQAKYPWIHLVLSKQILFRKLVDVYGCTSEWHLFLDSDMLFYKRPALLQKFVDASDRAVVQSDCWESYGYSRTLCEHLTGGARLPDAINIGVLGMSAHLIDWDKIEFWLSCLISQEGWKYNITQCVSAMILAGLDIQILPPSGYKVWPVCPDPGSERAVMEHYVADSKPWYFGSAWKLVA